MNQLELIGLLCMWMAIIEENLAMQYILTWTYSKTNLKIHKKQKCHSKYLQNTSIRFDNVHIVHYCICGVYVKWWKFSRLYKFIFSKWY